VLRESVRLQPILIEAEKNLTLVLLNRGKNAEAHQQLESALWVAGPDPVLKALEAHIK